MAKTPRVRILERIKELFDAADLDGMSGVAGIKVRHTRNRWANPDELPCISIRMVADETDVEEYHSAQEVGHQLQIDIQADAELATEDSELDPTGLERLGQMTNACLRILKDVDRETATGAKLRDLCDDVVDEGVQPDDDNEADEARFIHRIVVLYRTSIDDPMILLGMEENLI